MQPVVSFYQTSCKKPLIRERLLMSRQRWPALIFKAANFMLQLCPVVVVGFRPIRPDIIEHQRDRQVEITEPPVQVEHAFLPGRASRGAYHALYIGQLLGPVDIFIDHTGRMPYDTLNHMHGGRHQRLRLTSPGSQNPGPKNNFHISPDEGKFFNTFPSMRGTEEAPQSGATGRGKNSPGTLPT